MDQIKSLQDSAYREIKRRIVTLAYRPGQQINTALICEQLRIGRTPVHLAIHRLETEGLIHIQPRRGITVRPLDPAEIGELIEARLIVEPQVAALAAARGTERDFASMREALVRLRAAIIARDGEQFMAIDIEFHRFMAVAAKNRALSNFLIAMHERCLRAYFMSVSRNEQDVRIIAEHEELVAALERRDSDAAAGRVREHVESLRRNLRDLL